MSFVSPSRRLGRATTAIVFIGLASCRASGARRCTEASCSDVVEIKFEPALTAPGHYYFKVDLDGVTRSCSAYLPSSGQQDIMPECFIVEGNRSLTTLSVLGVRPKVVALYVARDQAVLMDTHVAPIYGVERPNGPGCSPECSVARVTVAIKEPPPGAHR